MTDTPIQLSESRYWADQARAAMDAQLATAIDGLPGEASIEDARAMTSGSGWMSPRRWFSAFVERVPSAYLRGLLLNAELTDVVELRDALNVPARGDVPQEASAAETQALEASTVFISPRRLLAAFVARMPSDYVRALLARTDLTNVAAFRGAINAASTDDNRRTAFTQRRAGDRPIDYTTKLIGIGEQADDLVSPAIVITPRGRVIKMIGAALIGLRERIALNPDHAIRIRWAFTRLADPADPAGHAVEARVFWLDQGFSQTGDDGFAAPVLTVANGRQEVTMTFTRDGAGGTLPWHPNAVYAVPYLRTYGDDGETALEYITWDDVTDIQAVIESGDGIPDAPADAMLYGRRNGAWEEIDWPEAGIGDAPQNGTPYVREDGAWTPMPTYSTPALLFERGIPFSALTPPGSLEVIGDIVLTFAWTLRANMAGSQGKVTTPPTSAMIFTVWRNYEAAGATQIGTITIGIDGSVTGATTGGAAIAFAIGDTLSVVAPASIDGALRRFRTTLLGDVPHG